MKTRKIVQFILLSIFFILLSGCSNTSRNVTYNEQNFDRLKDQVGITVKMIDGRVFDFYKVEMIKLSDQEIWLKTWAKKNSMPVEYVFRRSDIVIENKQYNQSSAVRYLLSMALIIGLVALLNGWLY
jgi:ABC-type molybdate transport system ATPase subunit